ncbi:hypothetical protein ACFLRF_05915 [Candidatus Altiarchaeota archaeon]
MKPRETHPGYPKEMFEFTEKEHARAIEGVKGIFSPKVRQETKRVVLLGDTEDMSLSWPLMDGSMLAQALPRNFPNADFIDNTGLMDLVRMPEGGRLISKAGQDLMMDDQAPDKDKTIIFFPSKFMSNEQREVFNQVSGLSLFMFYFGRAMGGNIHAIRPGQENIKAYFKNPGEDVQGIMDFQSRALTHMGLVGLPGKGQRLILSEADYSRRLNDEVTKVMEKAGGRPLILVNIGKKLDTEKPDNLGAIEGEILKLPGEVDARFMVNMGSPQAEDNIKEPSGRLQAGLRERWGDKVIESGDTSLLTFAAEMIAADRSGGLMLDMFSGSSLLADWVDAREALIELPRWDDFSRDRSNRAKIKADRPQDIIPKVKGLMRG